MPSLSLLRAQAPLQLSAALCLCACAVAPHRVAPTTHATAGAPPPPPASTAAAPPLSAPAVDLPANMPLPKLPPYARPDNDPSSNEAALAELGRARERTGLSDTQLARLQEARAQIGAGDSASALARLQRLNAELAGESRSYTVQQGESLWHIAAHNEVYGNPYLWPLLWAANQKRVQKPYQVYQGLRLTVPLHPKVQEVSAALAYGKAHASEAKSVAPAKPGGDAAAPAQAAPAAPSPTSPPPAPGATP